MELDEKAKVRDIALDVKFCKYLLDKFPENPDESILYRYFEKNLDYSRIKPSLVSDVQSLFRSLSVRIHKYVKSRYNYVVKMSNILDDLDALKDHIDVRIYNEIVRRVNSEISDYSCVYSIYGFYSDIIQWMKIVANHSGDYLYCFIKNEMHGMCDDNGRMDNLESHFRRNTRTEYELNELHKSIIGYPDE